VGSDKVRLALKPEDKTIALSFNEGDFTHANVRQ